MLAFPLDYVKFAGSGVSIKLLSVMQLLSATGFCIGRAMALPLFFYFGCQSASFSQS